MKVMPGKSFWINFWVFFVGFILATIVVCTLLIGQMGNVEPTIIQTYFIVLTGLFGFGSIVLQTYLGERHSEYLRSRNITENILIVKGVLGESNGHREKLADILNQPILPERFDEERAARLALLKSSYGTFDVFKVLPFMTNPEPLKGFEDKAIEVCLQYGTNFEEFFRLLRNHTEAADLYDQLKIEIEDCGDKYTRAITLLDSQYEALSARIDRNKQLT